MKALIVDDEPLARNELQYLLNLNDAIDEIEEAENIEETLEKLLYNTCLLYTSDAADDVYQV